MDLSIFIRRPKLALVISLVIVIIGVIAIARIPIAEYPEITPPQVTVEATYLGANAAAVEGSVASPIESKVNGVDDMIYMESKSNDSGQYELTVSFEVGTDPDIATVNVQNRVAEANAQLPAEVTRMGVTTKKKASSMLMVLCFYSPDGTRDALFMSNYVSIHVQDALARINGVGAATQFNDRSYSMRVWLDPDRLTAFGMIPTDVSAAIRSQNVQAAAGRVGAAPFDGSPQFQYTLRALGRLVSAVVFENIILRAGADGSVVRLRDVGRVELGAERYMGDSRLNGRTAAALAIYQSPGSNAVAVSTAVRNEIARLAAELPEDMDYAIPYDATRFVFAAIEEVILTIAITFAMVVLVTYLFLGDWRATIIPTLAIPVSLVGTFAVLFACGYSANMVTLFASLLAIGIVVDNSIIVVENVQHLMEETGEHAAEATRRSLTEITGPVITTTLVLLAVFVPVSFMPGLTGELYRQFAVTLCVAVVISGVNALTLGPALCTLLLKPATGRPRGLIGLFTRIITGMRNLYARIVAAFVRRAAFGILVVAIVGAAAVYLLQVTPTGFLPQEDKGNLFLNVQLPDGASLRRTQEAMDEIDELVRESEGVAGTIMVPGFSLIGGQGSNNGFGVVLLDPWEARQTPDLQWYRILDHLNRMLASVPSAESFAFPSPPIMGLGTTGGVEGRILDLKGHGAQDLAAVVRSFVVAANGVPALENVFSTYSASTPQYFLDVDRDKVQALGIPVSDLFATLQAYFGASYVNDFNLFGKIYKVNLQAEGRFRSKLDDLGRVHVRSARGDMVPLRSLVSVKPVLGPLTINRYNQFKSASVNASVASGFSSGDAIKAMERLAETELPDGYALMWTGTAQQELEAGQSTLIIFGFAFLFAYLFLVAQYESWTVPVAVILSIVFAMLGALVPLNVLPFIVNDLYAQIAIVMLIGFGSKSAILIVEFAKHRRDTGMGIRVAAVEAARLRFRSVMMIALAFILGSVPLILTSGAGAAGRATVGFVVVGGMLLATAVGIFFIPSLYVAIQSVREWLNAAIRRRSSRSSA